MGKSSEIGRYNASGFFILIFRFRRPRGCGLDAVDDSLPNPLSAPAPSVRPRQPPRQNAVGPQVAAVRLALGLSQDALCARCARLGWNLSENVVTKIERQVRCVTDAELFTLARALRVKLAELVPPEQRRHLF